MFDDTSKYGFMTLPEDVATGRLHFGFGMWIRNNWGLWRDSKLKHYFLDKGVGHPDDMSSIILTSYHRHLNNKPTDWMVKLKNTKSFIIAWLKMETPFHSQDLFQRPDNRQYFIELFSGWWHSTYLCFCFFLQKMVYELFLKRKIKSNHKRTSQRQIISTNYQHGRL